MTSINEAADQRRRIAELETALRDSVEYLKAYQAMTADLREQLEFASKMLNRVNETIADSLIP